MTQGAPPIHRLVAQTVTVPGVTVPGATEPPAGVLPDLGPFEVFGFCREVEVGPLDGEVDPGDGATPADNPPCLRLDAPDCRAHAAAPAPASTATATVTTIHFHQRFMVPPARCDRTTRRYCTPSR